MVRRALGLGLAALPLSALGGLLAGGTDGALSAAIGIVVVVANFAAHGLSLAWASRISIPVLQGVALGGFVVRMGVIVVALVLLDRTAFFSPAIFGVVVVAGTLALLGYEAKLVAGRLGGQLQIPPDPAAAAAGERLRAREEALR
ncbi:MAG: hypothetical protein ACRDJP_09470 [Actinomycetota bacterium]